MPKIFQHQWSILCQGIIIDQDTGNPSLHNIIQQISVNYPKLASQKNPDPDNIDVGLILVTNWKQVGKTKLETIKARVDLIDPKKKVIMRREYNLPVTNNKRMHRYRIPYDYMPMTVSGEYTFKVCINDSTGKGFLNTGKSSLFISITGESLSEN